MSNIPPMNVFVECHNSPCIHVCDIKKEQKKNTQKKQKTEESNTCTMGSAPTYQQGELVTQQWCR